MGSKILEQQVRTDARIKEIAQHGKERVGALPEMIELAGTGERPVKTKIALVFRGKGESLSQGHATEVAGKISSSSKSKIEGAPEFGVDLN